MYWVCPMTDEECRKRSCRTRANERAFGTQSGRGWALVGNVKEEDCGLTMKPVSCEGRCGMEAREGKGCPHGHGVTHKPLDDDPDYGEGWVKPMGRGCCPECKHRQVGMPFKLPKEQNDES